MSLASSFSHNFNNSSIPTQDIPRGTQHTISYLAMASTDSSTETEQAVYHLLPDHGEHGEHDQKHQGNQSKQASYDAMMMGMSCAIMLQLSFALLWGSSLLLSSMLPVWRQSNEPFVVANLPILGSLAVTIVAGAMVLGVNRLIIRGLLYVGATQRSWEIGFVMGRLTSSLLVGWQWAGFSLAFWVLFSLEALVLLVAFARPKNTNTNFNFKKDNNQDQEHYKNEIMQLSCGSLVMGVVRALLFQLFLVLFLGSLLLLVTMWGSTEVSSQSPQQTIHFLVSLVRRWLTSDFCFAFWILYFLEILVLVAKREYSPSEREEGRDLEDSELSVATTLV